MLCRLAFPSSFREFQGRKMTMERELYETERLQRRARGLTQADLRIALITTIVALAAMDLLIEWVSPASNLLIAMAR
jgi:hypothetical protein